MGERTADRVRGAPGTVAEAARGLRRTMTGAERVLWESLRDRRLDGLKFRRQYAVGPYVLDFCCPSRRLAIEVDGAVHDITEQMVRDRLRTEHLALFDYLVLRVRNEEVFTNLSAVLGRIAAVAASRQINAEGNTAERSPDKAPLSQHWERGRG